MISGISGRHLRAEVQADTFGADQLDDRFQLVHQRLGRVAGKRGALRR